MSVLWIVTLVAAGVLVLALAAYLLTIIAILRRIRETVGLILFGVRAIAHRAGPVEEIVGDINAALIPVRDALRTRLDEPGPPERMAPAAPVVKEVSEGA